MARALKSLRLVAGSLVGQATAILLLFVATGIGIMALIGYTHLDQVTEDNARIRLDRAARATASIAARALEENFALTKDEHGAPLALYLTNGDPAQILDGNGRFDSLVDDLAGVNQGAANVFRLNPETKAFERIATTFRKPDGTRAPSIAFGPKHPAHAPLMEAKPYRGNAPVLGRMRLAHFTPILTASGTVIGSLAFDVGWVDDLVRSRDELRVKIMVAAALILLVVASFGALTLGWKLQPLRVISRFAYRIAGGQTSERVPFLGRSDEIGTLAAGMAKVAELHGRLEHLAYYDPLTGLANRAKFNTKLDRWLDRPQTSIVPATMFFIDLDRFKETNDAFGHVAGDALLVEVTALLKAELAEGDLLARIGGDEFAILSSTCNTVETATALAGRLVEALHRRILLPQGEVHCSGSIGVVHLPHDAHTALDAYRNADLALFKAKSDGRARFALFAEHLNDDAQQKMMLARMLRKAIEENQLAVHFQPQIAAKTCTLHGVEALVRWPHPTRGFIPPSEFIPVAETAGLIVELGAWVLGESCRIARQWLDTGFEFEHVSVNVSPAQLWQPDFVDSVARALARNDLPAHRLCLEVTESLFVNHTEDRVLKVLNALRELGVTLSLDDFGSGYSSLGYLNRLPFDQLKIDRSFVANVDKDARKESLLRGMIALGKGLGLQLVAEGAETKEEVALLRDTGCDAIQGYFFARPVNPMLVQVEVDRIRREHAPPKATRKRVRKPKVLAAA